MVLLWELASVATGSQVHCLLSRDESNAEVHTQPLVSDILGDDHGSIRVQFGRFPMNRESRRCR
jgi:hypothetical protein